MKMGRLLLTIPIITLAMAPVHVVQAFNTETHKAMNAAAARICSDDFCLDTRLRDYLGFPLGIAAPLRGANGVAREVIDWIGEGGVREDDDSRFYRHFHDPLRSWDSAGLQLAPLTPRSDSSIVWMQEPQDSMQVSQGWSWQEARGFYYAALTAGDSQTREQKWADAFQAVGQIMHLIEDAAQPAHVRNDPHPVEYICRSYFGVSCGGNFEYWVSGNPGASSYSGAPSFQPIILDQATNHSEAPVAAANLIDNDIYLGVDANITVGTLVDGQEVTTAPVGIAEFTNANFFSEDSAGLYPHPDVNALVESLEAAPTAGALRRYFRKGDGDGLPLNPALVESVFGAALRSVPSLSGTYAAALAGQDENVWQAEAKVLIPKATEYAQGALDYFFRGRIDFVADFSAPNTYRIKNLGPEPMSGTFELYSDDMDGNRRLVPGAQWPGSLIPQGDMQVTATLPPAGASGKYTLVFHGDMGEEKASNGSLGAVVGKAVRTSSFLLLDTSKFSDSYIGYNGWVSNYWGSAWSAYRSDFVDRGWKRLGGDRTYNQPPILSGNRPSCALNDSVAFIWGTGDSLALADGSASLIPTPAGFSSLPQALDAPLSVACLGGSELLFTYVVPQQSDFGTSAQLRVAYSPDLGVTAQPREGLGGGVMTYVGDASVLLQAGNVGSSIILRSTDKGLTWSALDATFDGETLRTSDPNDPISDRLVFNVMAWNHVEGDGSVVLANGDIRHDGLTRYDSFWRSTDGGDSWRFLPMTFTDGYALASTHGFESLAMSPQGEVLASFEANEGTQGSPTFHARVARSLDAGETWQLAELPEPIDNVLSYTTMGLDVGFPYYSVVHVPPVVLYWPQ